MAIETSQIYQVLAESSPDAILSVSSENIIFTANPAAERLFGYSLGELIGQSLLRLIPERFRLRHSSGMAHFLATGERRIPWQGVRVPILRRDGAEVPVEISFGVFTSADGPVFSAILRDVTALVMAQTQIEEGTARLQEQAVELEQQIEEAQVTSEELEQANQELRDRQAEYDALANSIPTLAWMARGDGWIFWYNQRWYEYTGTSPADMEGWGWQSVHDPERLPAVLEEWTASIATGNPFEMTFPLRGADGRFRPFLTRVSPLRDERGRVVRWFGTNTDVSPEHEARSRAEQATVRLQRLQTLTARLAETRTLSEVASVVMVQATQASGALTGMLTLRSAEGTDVEMVGNAGLPDPVRSEFDHFPLDRPSPSPEAIRTGCASFVERRDGPNGLDARWPTLESTWTHLGVNAVAALPLFADGQTIGALTFTFAAPRAFDGEDREFLTALAAQTAQAIERVRAFNAERTERERSMAIVEAITDGFLSFDSGMRFTYANARAAEMLGASRQSLIGVRVTDLPNAEDSLFVKMLREVIATGRPQQQEGYGSIMSRWIDARAYPAEHGGAVVYFRDVTDAKRRQEASAFVAETSKLLTSDPDYRATLRNLARSVIPRLGDWCAIDLLLDPAPGVDQPVPIVERVALVHQDPAKVDKAREYMRRYPPDLADANNATSQAIRGTSVLIPVIDERAIDALPDQSQATLLRELGLKSVLVVPLRVAGRVIGAMTLCTGESGRQYDAADLGLAEDVASRAATAVEHARLLERAESANAAKAEFLRTVSHELRQPLNAIGGLLQLWELGLRGDLTDEQRADLDRIRRNQLQLSAMIEDILGFARIEAGKLEVDRVAIPVEEILRGISVAMDSVLEGKQLRFIIEPAPAGLEVLGDATRVHQILVNLVSNAVKATPPNGEVRVTVEATGSRVSIAVRDTGIGISEEHLAAIFIPFFQVGRSLSQPREGAGLGLAISRGLAEAMGGTLTAESQHGGGSTFRLSLPSAVG